MGGMSVSRGGAWLRQRDDQQGREQRDNRHPQPAAPAAQRLAEVLEDVEAVLAVARLGVVGSGVGDGALGVLDAVRVLLAALARRDGNDCALGVDGRGAVLAQAVLLAVRGHQLARRARPRAVRVTAARPTLGHLGYGLGVLVRGVGLAEGGEGLGVQRQGGHDHGGDHEDGRPVHGGEGAAAAAAASGAASRAAGALGGWW